MGRVQPMLCSGRSCAFLSLLCFSAITFSAFSVSGAEQARFSGNYLIVAAEGFAADPALAAFISAKSDRGFDVQLYSVPSGTSRADIDAYIGIWYKSGVPCYLLIIGDSEETIAPSSATTIPQWWGMSGNGPTSDLPYACKEGDDWYPDIYVGRWPLDTIDELHAIVEKTLAVEAGVFPDPSYIKRVALLATSDTYMEAEQTHEYVISNYLDPAGITTTRIYSNSGGDTPDIAAAINAGSLITLYFGHSGFNSWWDPSFAIADIRVTTNDGLYGLGVAMSCSNAGWDWSYGECMGEISLREEDKGFASYIATTSIIIGGMGGPRLMEKALFKALFDNGTWQVGPAWYEALAALYSDPSFGPDNPETQRLFEMFVLLGDPSMELPHDLEANGDFDADGDVDLADFLEFQACFGKDAIGKCAGGNLSGGASIDNDDYAEFDLVMSGPQ